MSGIKLYFLKIKVAFDKSQLKKYIKHNFFDSIYSILNLLIASLDGFFFNIILVRYLTLSDLGNYKLYFSILNIFIILSVTGMNTSVSKSTAKKYKRFFIRASKLSGLFSISATILMIILAFSYYKGSNIKLALLYSSFLVPIYFGFNIWESFLYGQKDFKRILFFNTLIAVVRFSACSTILLFLKNYIFAIIAYMLIVSIFNLIFFFWIYRKVKDEKPDLEKEKELIKHGFRLTGASAISVIAKNVERIILDGVSNAALVGTYSIVSVFPSFVKNSLKNLINVPSVKLASYTEKDNRRIIRRSLLLIFITGIVLVIIFWFITPFLLKFFFKVKDPEVYFYGKLLLIPLIFMPIDLTIKYMMSYQGSGKSYFKLSTVTDIIKLASLAIFIPIYKILGIIIGQIIGEFISFIILGIWFLRTNKKLGLK